MENLGEWGETVSRARSIGYDIHVWSVSIVVHSHHEDWYIVFWRSGNDCFLSSTLQMKASFLSVCKDTSRLSNVVCTNLSPWNLGWVGLLEDLDRVAIDFDPSVSLFDSSLEASMNGVVREQIDQVVQVHEWVVNGLYLSLSGVLGESGSESEPSDSSKAVDS